jgi:serine/threonine protein kinase
MMEPGDKLAHYEIRSLLGKGGMGEVYRATDAELGRSIAIKILPAELATDDVRLQRFIQEAKAVSALNHPHILTIYEIGAHGDSKFIATEFIDGETRRQKMDQGIRLFDHSRSPGKLRALRADLGLVSAHAPRPGAGRGANRRHRNEP